MGFLIKNKNINMAICNALTGVVTKSCDNNVGGINRIFIADYVNLNPTESGNEITNLSPTLDRGIYVVTTTATINTSEVAGAYVITNIEITGDLTGKIKVGKQIKFSYATQTGGGNWTGHITSVTYDSGTDTTTVTPDFGGFAPVVGTVAGGAAPYNTDNQSVTTFLFFEFQTNKNVCNFTEEAQIDMVNGTSFFNQVLTLVLNRRDTAKRDAIEKLINGQKELAIIFQDSNSNYWLMGRNEGSYVTAITGGSGTAKADANNYTITFTAMEPEQAIEVTSSTVTKFVVTA